MVEIPTDALPKLSNCNPKTWKDNKYPSSSGAVEVCYSVSPKEPLN